MTQDASLLAGARKGDAQSFEHLVAPYRREIVSHCYRMLGSMSDADDLAQECFLRAWRGIGGFDERASLRTWLHRIATNACLTEIEKRPRRGLPDERATDAWDGASPPAAPVMEPVWLEPCPPAMWEAAIGPEARYSSRESVAIAFLALIQNLPATQRAVLIFRDVLGWSAAETASALETSEAAVNSALQRARDALDARRTEIAEPIDPHDERAKGLLLRYIRAWESGDVDALAALLHEDARLAMPPIPTWFRGRMTIVGFLRPFATSLGPIKMLPIEANGSPAAACYIRAPGDTEYRAQSIQVLSADANGIVRLDVFLNTALFAAFGLAPVLDAH